MALKYTKIRGTRDTLPAESGKWRYVERIALEVAENYGFREIRTPIIEKTELFTRSVGESTDVQKEMYTFEKGKESITLRPEGTAGVARAVMENGLLGEALPVKVSYICPCFRHDNPQAGRYRQFYQLGVECFGSPSPTADAEVIALAGELVERLGLDHAFLEINSIGCPQCRPAYLEKLVEYYRAREDKLCHTCKARLEKNPLRLLDCKEPDCKAMAEEAPKSVDHLCGECADHFQGLRLRLDALGTPYRINPMIVRGLDYYTKTVFELVYDKPESDYNKLALAGGGRYDGLVEELGGQPTAGLGFGMGLDRILLVMEENGCDFPGDKPCDIYIGSMGDKENVKALELCARLREEGFLALCDTVGRSVKAQMKYANKIGAAYSCIIGSNELAQGEVSVKRMEGGETAQVALDGERMVEYLYGALYERLDPEGGGDLLRGLLEDGN